MFLSVCRQLFFVFFVVVFFKKRIFCFNSMLTVKFRVLNVRLDHSKRLN